MRHGAHDVVHRSLHAGDLTHLGEKAHLGEGDGTGDGVRLGKVERTGACWLSRAIICNDVFHSCAATPDTIGEYRVHYQHGVVQDSALY